MAEQNFFNVPPDVAELTESLEKLTAAYDQLGKDYQEKKREIIRLEALNSQLTIEKGEAEKQLNDMIIHTQSKMEQVNNLTIEIPSILLYGLAFDWQTPSPGPVFVCCNRDTGEVNLRTPEEMDPDRKPTFRHWWLTKVCDVKSGQGASETN